jgi:hypothetical protein
MVDFSIGLFEKHRIGETTRNRTLPLIIRAEPRQLIVWTAFDHGTRTA